MNGTDGSLIHTENVTKVYNPRRPDEVCAVDRVTVGVGRGEIVAIKGPSGSGKTSLLSLIGCMARPTSGSIVVDGRDVAKLSEEVLTGVRRKKFGFIFQQFSLDSERSQVLAQAARPHRKALSCRSTSRTRPTLRFCDL